MDWKWKSSIKPTRLSLFLSNNLVAAVATANNNLTLFTLDLDGHLIKELPVSDIVIGSDISVFNSEFIVNLEEKAISIDLNGKQKTFSDSSITCYSPSLCVNSTHITTPNGRRRLMICI